MYEGQIITYKIAPLPGFSQTWVTEIKSVEEKKYFIDEQRFGPYKFWHHKHFFEENKDGVLMTDLVHYAMPFGFVGKIAHILFVKKMLKNIFSFRRQFLENKFNIRVID
ncbi:MAG: SRPBCC family protein [Melioribacteraceae bacterium]|nr:MAG: SRPBCC family protein [Melioribacteraceae bacterium]